MIIDDLEGKDLEQVGVESEDEDDDDDDKNNKKAK
jgi:hypothetical protein